MSFDRPLGSSNDMQRSSAVPLTIFVASGKVVVHEVSIGEKNGRSNRMITGPGCRNGKSLVQPIREQIEVSLREEEEPVGVHPLHRLLVEYAKRLEIPPSVLPRRNNHSQRRTRFLEVISPALAHSGNCPPVAVPLT